MRVKRSSQKSERVRVGVSRLSECHEGNSHKRQEGERRDGDEHSGERLKEESSCR